jgi:hypothetical protein
LRQFFAAGALALVLLTAEVVHARDFGLLFLPTHRGSFSHSLIYEHLKISDDFDTRGHTDFRAQVAGTQVTYGVSDRIAVAMKGGLLVEPEQRAQGSKWKSRAGYIYGIDLFNEVFPATSFRPGIQLSAGISSFYVPLNQLTYPGGVTLIDQRLTGIDYHGSAVAAFRWKNLSPYCGLKANGQSLRWRDNRPASGGVDVVDGKARRNLSVVVGSPLQITRNFRVQFQGTFIGETSLNVGATLASF